VLGFLLGVVGAFVSDTKFYDTGIPLWIVLVASSIEAFLTWPKQQCNTRILPSFINSINLYDTVCFYINILCEYLKFKCTEGFRPLFHPSRVKFFPCALTADYYDLYLQQPIPNF
jgi:hypothetical protein